MALFLAVGTLLWREMVRFLRQRSRVVGALLQPLVLWVLLGAGLRGSFRPPGTPAGTDYVEYFYPGVIALVLLFTAIFTTISTIQDRREGFLQGVLVAPVPRYGIVLGQALGGTALAVLEGLLLLLLAPAVGIPLTVAAVLSSLAVMFVLSFGLTGLGLVIAWRMESVQGFHAIMNLVLMPLWFLSGGFFPAAGAPAWIVWAMRVNPLTYGVAALRRCLYWASPGSVGQVPPLSLSVFVTVVFSLVVFLAAVGVARRRPV
ncbi:MAG: ABC transporter permease [Nitrospinota bacterium]